MNEQAQRLGCAWQSPGEATRLVCECAESSCTETIAVPAEVYQEVRSHPRRFLIRPGHEQGEFETVVGQTDAYLVVEKMGTAGRIAEQTDPNDG